MIGAEEYRERITSTGSTATRLPQAQWDVLLAVADGFKIRMPGPDKRRSVDQALVLWQRVVRYSEGPRERYVHASAYNNQLWWVWPAGCRGRVSPGRDHLARSRLTVGDARVDGLPNDHVQTFTSVQRFEAMLVLLAAVVEEESRRVDARLTVPDALLAESSRLLVSGRVEHRLA